MPYILIFLVCLTVFWLPYLIANFIGAAFFLIDSQLAIVIMGILLCIFTVGLMQFLRQRLDRPTVKDYGLTSENLGSNLILTIKLIFIIVAVEYLLISIFQSIGISFEGGVTDVDIFFIISAVIIAPIFEETVYRMNASTLLARRLPLVWVAAITSTWFIAKHVPMWHFEHNFGLPSLFVILLIDIPLWWVITYYYLKRNCIWIPVLVHVFNNGSIALFHFLSDLMGFLLELVFVFIGVVFIFVYGIPMVNNVIIKKFKAGKLKPTKETFHYFLIFICFSALFLITSEALISLERYNPIEGANIGVVLCGTIGAVLLILSIITVVYLYANKNIVYLDSDV